MPIIVAGVALGAQPAVAQRAIVAETPVSTPVYGQTYQTNPEAPSISCNAAGCLAAWRESRTGVGYDVWARRLAPDGTPQGHASFLIQGPTSGAGDPAVATDGSRFMIATTDFASHIFVTRIDPDGTTRTTSVSANVMLPSGATTFTPRAPAIAHGDTGYLVSYAFGPGATEGPVLAFRVDAEGNLLDQQPLTIASDTAGPDAPAVAWTGNQYIVAWNNGGQALAARILSNGSVLDPEGFAIGALGDDDHRPRLAFGGGTLLLVAGATDGLAGGIPDVLLLDANAKNSRRVSLPSAGGALDAAWNGNDFVVSWMGGAVSAARLTPAGTWLDSAGLALTGAAVSPAGNLDPSIAAAGATAFVVYVDSKYPNELVRLTSLAGDGTVDQLGNETLAVSAPAQHLRAVAHGVGESLVVWSDEPMGQDGASLLAARVSDQGSVLDAQPIVLAGNITAAAYAGAAWGTDSFLVSWRQADPSSPAVEAIRIDATSGHVLDAAAVTIGAQGSQAVPISVVASAGTFLVSWGAANSSGGASACTVTKDLKPSATFAIGPAAPEDLVPYATMGATDGFVAVWAVNAGDGIHVSTIAGDGTVAPAGMLSTEQAVSLALSPTPQGGLVWLDGDTGFMVPSAPPFVAGPTFTVPRPIGIPIWVGDVFLGANVLVTDEYENRGLQATVMEGDGTLRDPPATLVSGDLVVDSSSAVGLGGPAAIIAYSRLAPTDDLGNMRVFFQMVGTDAVGGGADGDASGGAGPASDAATAPTDASGVPRADASSAPDGQSSADAGVVSTSDASKDLGGHLAQSSGCACALGTESSGSLSGSFIALGVLLALTIRRRPLVVDRPTRPGRIGTDGRAASP